MALSSTTMQQPSAPAKQPVSYGGEGAASILAALMLTVFAAQKSKKQLRKLKRQAIAQLFKYKVNTAFSRVTSLFSKKAPASIDNRTLLYILLGVAVLILIFIAPIAAIILLLLGILLILLTK
jgi:hypothetical protein